ncbi:MAG: hypothetical protein NTW61_02875 [Candidatus Melainabacteria bacterium]|nr:hypothetical protein [Candidatus Melainabacteria bacterium]
MMLSFAFAPQHRLVRGVQLAESPATQGEPVVVADKPILQPNQPDSFTPITPPPRIRAV